MLLTIVLILSVAVFGYLVYKFFKKNKAIRNEVIKGLKDEAGILGDKIKEESKELAEAAKKKIKEIKK